MPHIIIDGRRIETREGKTVIQAALENGIQITHFCWHPELSISGNCRMCLVEIGMPRRLPDGSYEHDADGNVVVNYFPKLQIACATNVADGMYVRTNTEKVVKAQEAVMEFMLINHPLDCPICDEAGQCKLQEYAFRYSSGESRFEEEKTHGKKHQSWGPNVIYDAERCIKCSRCIRYAREIAGQDVLTFVNRGDHVTIDLAEGSQFDNDYSMNVIELCPVGALTSKDFRFKARVWDMSFNDSICAGCGRGCNIKIGVRNNEILRIEPRANLHVNKYWLCDYGRLTQYPFVNNNRISEPAIVKNGELNYCSWDEALNQAGELLKKYKPHEIMFLGSAKATNEDNYLLAKFARKIIKTNNIDFLRYIDKSFGDKFLRVEDKTPNSIGAKEVGIEPGTVGIKVENLAEKIRSGAIKVLYSMDDDFLQAPDIYDELDHLDVLILHAHNESEILKKANVIFPTSTYAEVEGTYTNVDKRVQHYKPALVTNENLRKMGMKQSRLDKFGAPNDRWTSHELRNCLSSWLIIRKLSERFHSDWKYFNAGEVFNEITLQVHTFRKMSYELLDEFMGIVLDRGEREQTIEFIYESHEMKPE